jgi:hypothetical protein
VIASFNERIAELEARLNLEFHQFLQALSTAVAPRPRVMIPIRKAAGSGAKLPGGSASTRPDVAFPRGPS